MIRLRKEHFDRRIAEKIDEYEGYSYFVDEKPVLRGCVFLPQSHPIFKDVRLYDNRIKCHEGLTLCERVDDDIIENNERYKIIGWDYGHVFDYEYTVKDAKEECKAVIRQLIELAA